MKAQPARNKDNVVPFPRCFDLRELDPAAALSCLRAAIMDIEDVYRRFGQRGLQERHRAALDRALAMTSYVRDRL